MEIKRFSSYLIPHTSYLIPHTLYLIFVFLLFLAFPLVAQEKMFSQKIEWKSNANALEYRVEVQNTATGKTQTITTDKNNAELSLVPGKYRYRVRAYDFLGKEASVSAWTNFEVFQANKPNIRRVDQKVEIQKNTNSIEIGVNISDVNANSTFELVNDSLVGAIPSSDKSKMGTGASETESVSKLQFKDVPIGTWRLKVTNASGLSSLSAPIVVEGEKTYTAEEVAQIKKETEDAIRKDMQDNLDEYIRIAEAEKAERERQLALEREEAERKRLAEEARLKAEREAAEKARLAEEKRIAEEKAEAERQRIAEEKRIAAEKAAREKAEAEARAEEERLAKIEEERRRAEEKARLEAERIAQKEAEKKAKAEWKAAHPYQWKDIIFEGGAGYTFNVKSSTITDWYEERALSPSFRAIFLPWKTQSNKFGMEFALLSTSFKTENSYFYDGTLKSTIFDVKFVWQHKLFSKLFWSVKGGFGFDSIKTSLSYTSSYEVDGIRNSPDEKHYVYPAFTAGASLFFYPWKFIVFEIGADFSYVLSGSVPLGLATPYACIGFRF